MPDALLLVAACLVTAVLTVTVTIASMRLRRKAPRLAPDTGRHSEDFVEPGELVPDPSADVILWPTERDNEVFAFGAPDAIATLGTTFAETPRQLASHASSLRAAVDGVRTAGEMSGRLVRVDGQTADAIKAGKMAKDAAGQMLAQVKASSGQFSHITRLSVVGKLAAVTSMTSALSAMALQAQLDRIEGQLAAVTDKVNAVHDELLLQWHSELRGISLTLGEVHRTAIAAGTFTQAQWDQIAPLGAQIKGHLDADLKRLAQAATQLAHLGEQANLTRRSAAIPERVDDVERAHRAALASVTAWIRFSELRLWHLAVTDDPSLPAYQAELETQLDVISTALRELPWKVRGDIQELSTSGRWWRRIYHRRGARRLPLAVEESVARINGIDWDPVRPKSRDVVQALDPPGTGSGSG